jgi:hypothetical protein
LSVDRSFETFQRRGFAGVFADTGPLPRAPRSRRDADGPFPGGLTARLPLVNAYRSWTLTNRRLGGRRWVIPPAVPSSLPLPSTLSLSGRLRPAFRSADRLSRKR